MPSMALVTEESVWQMTQDNDDRGQGRDLASPAEQPEQSVQVDGGSLYEAPPSPSTAPPRRLNAMEVEEDVQLRGLHNALLEMKLTSLPDGSSLELVMPRPLPRGASESAAAAAVGRPAVSSSEDDSFADAPTGSSGNRERHKILLERGGRRWQCVCWPRQAGAAWLWCACAARTQNEESYLTPSGTDPEHSHASDF